MTLNCVPEPHVGTILQNSNLPLWKWFLAVYVIVTALVPAFLAAHERAGGLVLVALGLGAVLVDGMRGRSAAYKIWHIFRKGDGAKGGHDDAGDQGRQECRDEEGGATAKRSHHRKS